MPVPVARITIVLIPEKEIHVACAKNVSIGAITIGNANTILSSSTSTFWGAGNIIVSFTFVSIALLSTVPIVYLTKSLLYINDLPEKVLATVTGDGTKTNAILFAELYNAISDKTKVRIVRIKGSDYKQDYHVDGLSILNNNITGTRFSESTTEIDLDQITLSTTSANSHYFRCVITSSGTTFSNRDTTAQANGVIISALS